MMGQVDALRRRYEEITRYLLARPARKEDMPLAVEREEIGDALGYAVEHSQPH